jgi:hypothetical protein
MKSRTLHQAIAAIGLLGVCVAGALMIDKLSTPYPEAAVIAEGVKDYDELSARFYALAYERGGPYAFEVLGRTELPAEANLHGLAHRIAQAVYEEKGPGALGECPAHFQPACGHEFARQSLQEFGLEEGAGEYAKACATVPGGQNEHHECFHGLGHGLMEFLGYSLADVLAVCGNLEGGAELGPEYRQCAGGALMEILRGGEAANKYNPPEWYVARAAYLSKDRPLSFCLSGAVPPHLKEQCFSLSAPWILEAVDARFALDDTTALRAAFDVCNSLGDTSREFRGACFAGLGNEFVLLEGSNEISRAGDYNEEAMRRLVGQCGAASTAEGQQRCLKTAYHALSRVEDASPAFLNTFCTLSGEDLVEGCPAL